MLRNTNLKGAGKAVLSILKYNRLIKIKPLNFSKEQKIYLILDDILAEVNLSFLFINEMFIKINKLRYWYTKCKNENKRCKSGNS